MDVAALYEEQYEGLCRYLFRFTGDADQARDVAQEAFIRLLDQSPRTNPRAWVFKVATNLALEWGRTHRRRDRLLAGAPQRAPLGDAPAPPDLAFEAKRRLHAIQGALLQLSAKERTAVLMREEGFSQREIAEAVGTTTKSVGTLIARALGKLADHFDPEPEEI